MQKVFHFVNSYTKVVGVAMSFRLDSERNHVEESGFRGLANPRRAKLVTAY